MSDQHQQLALTADEVESAGTIRLSTGIDVLDRRLGDGIAAGRVVALSAVPASQSELFLYEMGSVRETVYLSTERSASDVEDSLTGTGASFEEVAIHRLSAEEPLADAWRLLEDVSEQSTLIIDPVNPLEEAPAAKYRAFLNEIKTRVADTQSLAILHCLEGRRVPDQRDRTEYIADIIFDLQTRLRGDSVENRLSIPKFRGGESLTDAIELDLTSDVTIDVSRKIA